MDKTPLDHDDLEPEKIENETEDLAPTQAVAEKEESAVAEVMAPIADEASKSKPFAIRIDLTRDDFLDALQHINKINWMTWATMGIFVVIMGTVLVLSLGGAKNQTSFNLMWSVALILAAVYLLFNGLYLNPRRLSAKLADDPSLKQNGTITIDERGLIDSRSTSGKPLPWSIFKDLFETDNCYLLMSTANRGAYQVLPKHSFIDPAQAEEFRAFAVTMLPKASLRRIPLRVFPLVMLLLSIGMFVWVLFTRMQ